MDIEWEDTIGKTPDEIFRILKVYPFAKQLSYHMEFGTRPSGEPGRPGVEWTRAKLADRLGRSASGISIGQWLRGDGGPDADNRIKLRNTFFGANEAYADIALAFTQSAARVAKEKSPFREEKWPDLSKNQKLGDIEKQVHVAGWRLDRLLKGEALTHPGFNSLLLKGQLNVRANRWNQKWTIHDQRPDLLKYIRDTSSGDTNPGRKIRLASELIDQAKVTIQETNYFDSLVTDQCAWKMVSTRAVDNKGHPKNILCDGISDFISQEGKLLDYDRNNLSNQVGASTLAFSKDGALLVVYQNDRNSQSPETLAPSGSGSLDWTDVPQGQDHDLIREIVLPGAKRELEEECRLNSGKERNKEYTEIKCTLLPFAFAKMLHRGSKPEFYFIAAIHAAYRDVIERKPNDRYVEKVIIAPDGRANWSRSLPSVEIKALCESYLNRGLKFDGKSSLPSYPLEHSLKLLGEQCGSKELAPIIDEFFQGQFLH